MSDFFSSSLENPFGQSFFLANPATSFQPLAICFPIRLSLQTRGICPGNFCEQGIGEFPQQSYPGRGVHDRGISMHGYAAVGQQGNKVPDSILSTEDNPTSRGVVLVRP